MAGRSLLPPSSHPSLSVLRSSPNPNSNSAFRTTSSSTDAAAQPGSSSPFLSFLLPQGGAPGGAAGPGGLPPFPASPNFSTLTNVLANLGAPASGNATSSAGTGLAVPAAMTGQAATPGGTAKGNGEGAGSAVQTDGTVVSCVFVIEATLRGRQAWKAFGETYLRAVIAKVQGKYPRASAIRILPLLFTSLPPSTPFHLSLLQPLPYSSPSELLAALPTLFDTAEAANTGGDEPAFLDAIVRAVELLDRPPPSLPPSANTTEPLKHKKHLILFAATDLTPADLPFFSTNPQNPSETWSAALPALSQSEEFDSVGWVELLRPFFPPTPGSNKGQEDKRGLLEKKEVMVGMVLTNPCARLTWLLRRCLGVPLSMLGMPLTPSDGIKLLAPSHLSFLRGLDTLPPPPSVPSAQPSVPAKRPAGPSNVQGNGRGTPQAGSSPLTNLSNNALHGSGPPAKKARFADPPPTQQQQPAPSQQQPQPSTSSAASSENQNRSQLGTFPNLASALSGANLGQAQPSQPEDSLSAALAALEATNTGGSFLTTSSAQASQPMQGLNIAGHARQQSNASSVNSNALPNISNHNADSNSGAPGIPPQIPLLFQTAETVPLIAKTCPHESIGGVSKLMRLGVGEKVPSPQEVGTWMEATKEKGAQALREITGKLERREVGREDAEVQLRKLKAVVDGRMGKFSEMRILVGKLWREHLSRSNVPLNFLQPQGQGQGQGQQQPGNVNQNQQRPPQAQQPPQPTAAQLQPQPGLPASMRMLWRGMLQWRLPTANQQEGRTFAAAVIPAAHSTFNEAAGMLKNFPNVWTLHIRKDSIAAAREYAAQNRMVIVQIAAITPDMMPNAPAAVLDKAGHPAAGGGNPGGFAYLLQGLLTNGMIAFVSSENGRGAVFLPDTGRRSMTCMLFGSTPVPRSFGNLQAAQQQPTQQQPTQQQQAAALLAQNPGLLQNPALLQAFIQQRQQQAAQQAQQQKAAGAQQAPSQGIVPQQAGQGQGPMGFGGPAGGTTVGLGNASANAGSSFNPNMYMNNPQANAALMSFMGNFGQ